MTLNSPNGRNITSTAPLWNYDYEKDPDALNNLIDDSSHQKMIQTHLKKLLQLMEETGDHELPNFIKTFNITKE
jgi:hypothetical protein